MIVYADRVKDTSTSTGTGSFTLAASNITGFRTFNAAFGVSTDLFPYVIDGGAEVEVGYGYLSASTTLVRSQVTYSTNANALVNFSAGTKTVFSGPIANQGPKVYRALLTQTGTSAPVPTVMENTLGGAPSYGRSDVGIYTLTLTGAFPTEAKTYISISPTAGFVASSRSDSDSASIATRDRSGDFADGWLYLTAIEILVYP